MDFTSLVTNVLTKKQAMETAKARYQSADQLSKLHCTDDYARHSAAVKQAFAEYNAAYEEYNAALRAVADHAGDLMQAAWSEIEPAFNLHGDQTIYYEGKVETGGTPE